MARLISRSMYLLVQLKIVSLFLIIKVARKTMVSNIFNTVFLWRYTDKEIAVILKRISLRSNKQN